MGTCFILIVINPLKINAKHAVASRSLHTQATACVATPHTRLVRLMAFCCKLNLVETNAFRRHENCRLKTEKAHLKQTP